MRKWGQGEKSHLFQHRCVDHGAVESKGALAFLLADVIRVDDSSRSMNY